MKRVVVLDDLHESELRPSAAFAEYLVVFEREVRQAAVTASTSKAAGCPACQHPSADEAMTKWSWRYVRCSRCRSLFLDPSPDATWLAEFHAASAANRLWNERVVAGSLEARRERLFRPRAAWVLDAVAEQGGGHGSFVDFGTRHPGFLEEVASAGAFTSVMPLRPDPQAATACAAAGFPPVELTPAGSALAATAFEVLEGTGRPAGVIEALSRALQPGGLLLLTTRAGSGFDVQVLRDRAPNLLPLLHVTLLSVEGVMGMVQDAGFELLELSTPGQLDMEIVTGAARSDPTLELPPFIEDLVRRRDERVHAGFQEFLQQARLSSHLRLTARKLPTPSE